jgi:chemotaxis protein CheX
LAASASATASRARAVALKLVEAFAGASLAVTDPDFADAIGEVANMIAGGAKKDLGVQANITCPTVIIGAGHVVARLSDVPCLVVPCATPAGAFAVEVNIKPVRRAAVAAAA